MALLNEFSFNSKPLAAYTVVTIFDLGIQYLCKTYTNLSFFRFVNKHEKNVECKLRQTVWTFTQTRTRTHPTEFRFNSYNTNKVKQLHAHWVSLVSSCHVKLWNVLQMMKQRKDKTFGLLSVKWMLSVNFVKWKCIKPMYLYLVDGWLLLLLLLLHCLLSSYIFGVWILIWVFQTS